MNENGKRGNTEEEQSGAKRRRSHDGYSTEEVVNALVKRVETLERLCSALQQVFFSFSLFTTTLIYNSISLF